MLLLIASGSAPADCNIHCAVTSHRSLPKGTLNTWARGAEPLSAILFRQLRFGCSNGRWIADVKPLPVM